MTLAFSFALIGTRIVAMLLTAPVFGDREVPMYLRLGLAVLISLAVAPLIFSNGQTIAFDTETIASDLIAAMFTEAVIGGLIGLGVLIIYSSAQMIGALIGQMSGMQLDTFTEIDSGFGALPTSRLIGIVTAAVFVLIDGPELVMTAVLDSFSSVPIGQSLGTASVITLITTLLGQSFELTVRAIAPAVATLLASTVLVGMLSRTLPQLNLIQLGFSSNLAIMILAVLLTLSGCVWLVVDDVERALEMIGRSLNDFQDLGKS